MIHLSCCKDQTIGVFGLGKAGSATVAALAASGATVYAWDDKPASVDAVRRDVKTVHAEPFDAWPWDKIKTLVLSPGIPLTHPAPHAVVTMAKQYGCTIAGDIELLYRAQPEALYIGITGTNGKSTTTTLLDHILKSAGKRVEVGGNLGTAALSLAPLGKDGIYVLELSSYQLDLLHNARFNISVFLNVTPDHIDRHGDLTGYIKAKKHIFDRQQASDVAVIAVDDVHTKAIAEELADVKRVKVSAHHIISDGIYVEEGVLHDGRHAFDLRSIATLTGKHNGQNAAAAYAAARACGVDPETIYQAMKSFPGLRHRLQLVTTIRGVRFINDSKATNADATAKALAPFDTIYWIAGGKAKEGGIETLEEYFPHIAHAFLIGEAEESFAKTLHGKASYTKCGTLEHALEQAAKMAFAEKKSGAVILLSPACASFDQWNNFEERGDAFCDQALQLVGREDVYAS